MSVDNNHDKRINDLIEKLNEWVFDYSGVQVSAGEITSTGESNARIAQIERELLALGASYHRDGEQFVLDQPTATKPHDDDQAPTP